MSSEVLIFGIQAQGDPAARAAVDSKLRMLMAIMRLGEGGFAFPAYLQCIDYGVSPAFGEEDDGAGDFFRGDEARGIDVRPGSADQIGVHSAGSDEVNSDSLGGGFPGEGFGPVGQGVFGCAVEGLVFIAFEGYD